MHNKVICIILDGLNYQVAHDSLGYLQGLVEQQRAALYTVQSELPSMSRPLYECLLTGVRPVDSGITNNHIVRLSHHESVFSLASRQRKITAAVAYYWISELYNRAPWQPLRDRIVDNPALNIQHGYFYQWDHYPDDAVFIEAEIIRRKTDADFLLIHSMNIDDSGHKFGLNSPQYRNKAKEAGNIISNYLPDWLAAGYQVIVTSDHGMNNDGSHGGILAEERLVPLFVIGNRFSLQPCNIQQTEICGLLCELLAITHDKPLPQNMLLNSRSFDRVQNSPAE